VLGLTVDDIEFENKFVRIQPERRTRMGSEVVQPLVFQLVGDAVKEGASTLRRLRHVSRHQREDVCASHRLVRDDLQQSDASSRRVHEMFYEEAAMGTWLRRLFECVLKAILGALAELVSYLKPSDGCW
jgi:hypothetical protein